MGQTGGGRGRGSSYMVDLSTSELQLDATMPLQVSTSVQQQCTQEGETVMFCDYSLNHNHYELLSAVRL